MPSTENDNSGIVPRVDLISFYLWLKIITFFCFVLFLLDIHLSFHNSFTDIV